MDLTPELRELLRLAIDQARRARNERANYGSPVCSACGGLLEENDPNCDTCQERHYRRSVRALEPAKYLARDRASRRKRVALHRARRELTTTAKATGPAMDLVVRNSRPMVVAVSRKFHPPGYELEDVVQEGMLAVVEAARNFDPSRGVPFEQFSETVVRNRLADVVTKAKRFKHSPLLRAVAPGAEVMELFPDRAPQPPRVAEHRENLRLLAEATRETLTPFERESLVGMLNEVSYEDIAADGDLRRVDNSIQRARRKLRAVIA